MSGAVRRKPFGPDQRDKSDRLFDPLGEDLGKIPAGIDVLLVQKTASRPYRLISHM